MSGSLRIDPRPVTLTAGGRVIHAAEIRLGATPRGAGVVAIDELTSAIDGASVANDFAAHGYETVVVPTDSDCDDAALVDQLVAAADHLAVGGRSHDNVGLIGIGSAARVVLTAAAAREFSAAVSLSPTDGLDDTAALRWLRGLAATTVLRTPWLGLFADDGGGRVGHAVDALLRELRQVSPAHAETVTYRNVRPNFYGNGDGSLAHAASFEAWQRTREWFNRRVAPPLTETARAALARDVVPTAGRPPEGNDPCPIT